MQVNIDDYSYSLSPDRIAVYPLEIRDHSKLLVYEGGNIIHSRFDSLVEHLPANSLLVFNDTKVIPARLHFQKGTGADIEIFLLSPLLPTKLVLQAMQAERSCTWNCTIGNLKRWRDGQVLTKSVQGIMVEATLDNREEGHVTFNWDSEQPFAEIVSRLGETPLPPYLNRKAEEGDKERYQTIYSHCDGAVAAPTAGLHFTREVFDALGKKNIQTDFLTLHVSAGTFQPVKVKNAAEHHMHNEQIIVSRRNVENLLRYDVIIPVGTTSMRTIESLYWYGVKLLAGAGKEFSIGQNDPYIPYDPLPSKKDSLTAILAHMDQNNLDSVAGETSIYIMPGYRFQLCGALITNFHQPGSTLILLVAAFIGADWKRVYESALTNNYRFLSYGDSSLLTPKPIAHS